nr:cytochrome c oxidase subunit II [Flavobacteriales bacterium]
MTNLLIALVVLLTIAAMVQLVRVNELLSEITNKDTNEVTDEDNNQNGILFIIIGFGFLAFVIWQMITWDHLLLPPASSVHGAEIDGLMKVSMTLILVVFFALTPMLFYFAYKYRGKKENTAYFFAHNNKLEIAWTVIPTIVLTALIIYGLRTWDRAMNPDVSEATIIEVYSKQFDWTARYSGTDNILGDANFRLVEGRNTLGVDLNDDNSADDIVVREVHLPVNKPVLLKFRSR